MTLDDLPFDVDSPATRNGAKGRKLCRRHEWEWTDWMEGDSRVLTSIEWCAICHHHRDPAASRRGRANRSRGNRAELDVARSIPGARKMGPLGLPWDVEVGAYARLQVKKLVSRPSPAEIARLIAAIPATGDRLRGFVWVEAAGQGRRGQRLVWFIAGEFAAWHGSSLPVAHTFAGIQGLLSMTLAEWIAEFVGNVA